MTKICGIYRITSPSGKIYIGQSRDIDKRIIHYKNSSCKRQPILHNSIIKYGWDSHEFKIIFVCDVDDLNKLEMFYIKSYNTFNSEHGMNLTTGGEGHIFSKKSREKMSHNAKIRKYSDITKQRISKSLTGIKRSKETIEKMRKSKTGLIHTEESKQKIRNKKCGTYEIYNHKNKLIHKFHSNVKKEFRRLNFPEHRFCDSYKYKTKISGGIYDGWFVIKL